MSLRVDHPGGNVFFFSFSFSSAVTPFCRQQRLSPLCANRELGSMSGRRGEPAAAKKRALVTPPAATAKKPRVAAAEPEASPPLVLSSANAEAACAHLSAACPRLAALIAKHGPPNALLAMSLSATGKDVRHWLHL